MSDDEKQTEAATPPGEKAPTSGIEVMDDARTRALTEALQSMKPKMITSKVPTVRVI